MRIVPVLIAILALSALPALAYDPPYDLGGHQGAGKNNDELPSGVDKIDKFFASDRTTVNGLGNVRTFAGGKGAARYFFNQLVADARKEAGLGNGITAELPTGDDWNDYSCIVRFLPKTGGHPGPQLVAISYSEHTRTTLAWLNVEWTRDGRTGDRSLWNSHRIIFLDRYTTPNGGSAPSQDPPSEGYQGQSYSVAAPTSIACANPPALSIRRVPKPVRRKSHDTFWPFGEGGGGGEM